MPSSTASLLSYLRVMVAAWRDDPRDDAELLARFVKTRDEGAFTALVGRHGPLVWRTCQRLLGDTPDAEDAFQAVFLALARQAGQFTIKNIAGWLHRVARRVALDIQTGARRRRDLEQRLRGIKQPEAEEGTSRAELYAALDEELVGLPEQLRIPLVLRYLEGKTLEDVARIVGCSRRVLGDRLARGEAILRARLKRRGLVVGVVSVGALLGNTITIPSLQARLIETTARAAVAFRLGTLTEGVAEGTLRSLSFLPRFESSQSAALAEGVLKTMMVTKIKLVAVLLGVTLCLAGGGLLAYRALAGNATEIPQLADEPRGEAEAPRQPGAAARVDCYGDPLPAHALARMGTTRLWRGEEWLYGDDNNAFAFSPDGKMLAGSMDRMTVCLWDAATGKEIRRLTTKTVKGHVVHVVAWLDFSRDGKTLITVDRHQTVWWEVATGKFLRKQEYQGPERFEDVDVQSVKVTFLPDGKILGFGDLWEPVEKGPDGEFRKGIRGTYVWDLATGKEICQLRGPTTWEKVKKKKITATFSSDGKLLAVRATSEQKNENKGIFWSSLISLRDVATGKEIRQLTYGGYGKVALPRDGKTLASVVTDGFATICVWEVATGKKIHLKEADEANDWPLIYSPDGKTLVGGRTGRLWDVGTGKEIRSFGWKDARVALFSPDGKVMAVGDKLGSIRLWEVATGKEIGPRQGYRGAIRSVAYSPDGKTLASGGDDDMVRLWDVATGKEMRPLAKHTFGLREISIAYSPDGKMLVFIDGQVIHLWDTATCKEIRQFKNEAPTGGEYIPSSVAFSPNSKILATIFSNAGDQAIRLWEVATGRVIYQLPAHVDHFDSRSSLAFSPDGRLLAAPGKEKNTVSLWEVATGQPIGQLAWPKPMVKEESKFIRSLDFSPDGRMLATSSAGEDKIRLWGVASGKEIGHCQLNSGLLPDFRGGCTLAFSPDGRTLATAAQSQWIVRNEPFDPRVHLWEVPSGKEIGQLVGGHRAPVRTIAFSPDGKTLASGSDDLTCLVWDVTSFAGQVKPVLARPLPSQVLSRERLEAAWADLAKDPAKAYRAIGILQAVPTQAVPLLRTRLRPIDPPADPQQLQRWIADLDANNFTVREKARREIEKLGELALPALRQALKDRPSLESKRRLQELLAEWEPKLIVGSPRRLRELRAVQVLESIGTAEARQVLQAWAKGVAGARLTMEAEAALVRLAKRSAVKP